MFYIDLDKIKNKKQLQDKINQINPNLNFKALTTSKNQFSYLVINRSFTQVIASMFYIPKPKDKEITIQTIDEYLLLKLIGDDYEQTPLQPSKRN